MLGILAAVAIPSYQDYTKRAHVSAGFSAAGQVKELVVDYAVAKGEWPNTSNLIMPVIQQTNVSKLTVNEGVIYVDMSPSTEIQGQIILVPSVSNEQVIWSCNESTIQSKYLPSNCR
jgi:type IV pilus assembly protein PilA